MKKFLLCLVMIFSLCFIFACGDDVEIDDPPVDGGGNTPTGEEIIAEVKSLIEQTTVSYKSSLTGSINILLQENKDTKEIDLDYNLKSVNEINEFGIHYNDKFYEDLNGIEKEYLSESYLYVKNNKLYQYVNEVELVEVINNEALDLLFNNVSAAVILDEVLPYYNEAEFYEALTYIVTTNNVHEFSFDIINYQGNVINVDNAISIKLYVNVVEDKLVSIKLETVTTTTNSMTYIEFKGLNVPVINFPENVN